MANTIIGKVAPAFKGEYNSTTTYNRLDIVSYNGSSYVCIVDGTKNVLPTDENKWKLVAEKGETGYSDISSITEDKHDFSISDNNGFSILNIDDGYLKTRNFNSEYSVISSVDEDFTDFKIVDVNNNPIFVIKDGNIYTKNFKSDETSFVDNKFKDKTIGIIGDSISTFSGWLPSNISGYDGSSYASYYPKGDVNIVNKTWWYKVAVELGLDPKTQISNCAWSGSRVTGDSSSISNAYAGCSTRRIKDLKLRLNGKDPDIIICFISCNDWNANINIGDWQLNEAIPQEGTVTTLRSAYALMLYKIHIEYPHARVFCCTNLDDTERDKISGWPTNNSNGVTTNEWNSNIIEISKALGCEVINLHECGLNYANMPLYCVDNGLHPNDAGHTIIARKVINELKTKY